MRNIWFGRWLHGTVTLSLLGMAWAISGCLGDMGVPQPPPYSFFADIDRSTFSVEVDGDPTISTIELHYNSFDEAKMELHLPVQVVYGAQTVASEIIAGMCDELAPEDLGTLIEERFVLGVNSALVLRPTTAFCMGTESVYREVP